MSGEVVYSESLVNRRRKSYPAQATITKYHSLGSLNNNYCLNSSGDGEVKFQGANTFSFW